ncbi:glycoside hydrolase domain-containing protein [Cohnella hongkongensis]|uniref:Glycoside hydrolase domain-containing protein n=1 Tax=Cohnella hongkongensis TaxID=178337 RepID=A0ABV9FA60_9BACL
MDQMVLEVQKWLNNNYSGKTGYSQIAEDGITGTTTVKALTIALQIEIGISSPDGVFGPTTSSLCPTLSMGSNSNDPVVNRQIRILQGSLYCKGYSPGGFDGVYGQGNKNAIINFQSDAGLINPNGIASPMVMKALLSMDAYVNIGNPKIRTIQQSLNRSYSNTIGLIPCDGVYSKTTNKAMITAIQIEQGNASPDGVWGPNTMSLLPTLSQGSTKTNFVRLLQYALYVNGFDPNGFDGIFGSGVKQVVTNFQAFCMLTADGIAGKQTWASLMVSSGDSSRKGTACDCVTTITPVLAQTLVSNGYQTVGRYLVGDWKKIKDGELATIFNAGLTVFPIYQSSGNGVYYFNSQQGSKDAISALIAANNYGFPTGTTIYFAVDFDAVDGQVTSNIIPYFQALHAKMKALGAKYKIGIYGPRNVCSRVAVAGYSTSSFVSDMSTGFQGNIGFPLPSDWAFDQIKTITVGSGSAAIEIDNNIKSGRNPGVSAVVTPEVLTILDDINFDTSYQTSLYNELIPLADEQRSGITDLKAVRSPQSALDIIFANDAQITLLSQTYSMRKAMLQAILYRELFCEGLEDSAKDGVVISTYAYWDALDAWEALPPALKLITPVPQPPILMAEDSSTGYGQIFAATAIDAINFAIQNGINPGRLYDKTVRSDMKEVWFLLHDDQVYNIYMCAMVLIQASDYVQQDRDFYNYTESEIKTVLSRYNGTGPAATNYGNETYELYKVFEKYNKLVREDL